MKTDKQGNCVELDAVEKAEVKTVIGKLKYTVDACSNDDLIIVWIDTNVQIGIIRHGLYADELGEDEQQVVDSCDEVYTVGEAK